MALATDGIPTAGVTGDEDARDARLTGRADCDGVGGDRVRRRKPQAELGGEVAALVQHGGHEQATAGSLGAVGEPDRRQVVARAVDFGDAPFVDRDAGGDEMVAVFLR